MSKRAKKGKRGKESKAKGPEEIAEIKELLRPGDLVLYDESYDDVFNIHQREGKANEVGMVVSADWPRSIKVKWQRSGICDIYHRCELTVLSRGTQICD
jgi:hypothetical protein|tara:strand:+ start:101 stop:397 length:297 start_codon:yes stop_codon:yes gene_type:complete